MSGDINNKSNFVRNALGDVIIFVYEVPFVFWHYLQKIITRCDGIITDCDGLVYYKVRWTVITNGDSFFITKCDTVYYKLREVLQSAINLLQIVTGTTKCDDYYKLRQYRVFFEFILTGRCRVSGYLIVKTKNNVL